MTDLEKARKEPDALFWDELGEVNAVMLGVKESNQHLQPMAPYCDPQHYSVWFFTEKSSDLIDAVGAAGARAIFTLQSEDRHFYACAEGLLVQNTDREKVDEFWNPVAAAWYENGKDDPSLVMLQMTMASASIWASSGNPISFAWKIAKANLTEGAIEDMGERNQFTFES